MAGKHIEVPKAAERSVINRKGKQHQDYCEDWVSDRIPWRCNAHHIIPVTCFNPIQVSNQQSRRYVRRCILVSKWNINGGKKFKGLQSPKGKNNMIRLPLKSAYTQSYPTKRGNPYRRKSYPEDIPMHNSRYSEHYLYTKEVRKYLDDEIWKNLKENKEKHKGKGKDILNQLKAAEKHFRQQLADRGKRKDGTVECWHNRKTDPKWARPFSMAATRGAFSTKSPR